MVVSVLGVNTGIGMLAVEFTGFHSTGLPAGLKSGWQLFRLLRKICDATGIMEIDRVSIQAVLVS